MEANNEKRGIIENDLVFGVDAFGDIEIFRAEADQLEDLNRFFNDIYFLDKDKAEAKSYELSCSYYSWLCS